MTDGSLFEELSGRPGPLMPGSDVVEMYKALTAQGLAGIRQVTAATAVAIESLERSVGSTYAAALLWLYQSQKGELQKAVNAFNSVAAKVQNFIDQSGNPVRLREVSHAWTTLGGNVSVEVLRYQQSQIVIDGYWSGFAAREYVDYLPTQEGALADVKDTSMNIGATLNEIATAIETFWRDIATTLVDCATTLAESIAGLFTPDVVENVAKAVTGVVKSANECVRVMDDANKKLENSTAVLRTKLLDNSKFSKSSSTGRLSWPRPKEGIPTGEDWWTPGRQG